MTENVFQQKTLVTREMREQLNGHRAVVVWFTGLSGAGKTTLAAMLDAELHRHGRRSMVLDGDNVRQGLCSDLGFSATDRHENMRRVAEMARMTMEAGVIALVALISPFDDDRARVRDIVGADDFIEVYVRCPLAVCEGRDVKGLYRKARQGQIPEFTGISAPYEEPRSPHVIVDTSLLSPADCVQRIMATLQPGLTFPAP